MKLNDSKQSGDNLRWSKKVAICFVAATVSLPTFADTFSHRVEQYFNGVDTQNYQGNYSIIQQIGNNNRTNVTQSYSASYQTGNFSRINQRGDWNNANIEQVGGNNAGVILQKGNYHTANVFQSGNDQQLETYVTQLGQRSDVQVSQSGSGYRSISVEQRAYSGNARPVTVETY
ncbi:hypothetical protein [Vreelandella sp.]|uniref:hypothetical protein n=1 Tax=Vreelandella sp. TaxID=3137778 RepID=UPI003BA853D5